MHNALRAPAPALHRLLARLGPPGASATAQPLSARLSQWLEWTQAVALSAALDARAAPATQAPAQAPGELTVDSCECARVRAALANAILGDRAFAPPASAPPPEPTFFRQRYVALQQVMEADISHLRGRLRGLLVHEAPQLAPLAAIDAVMERTLGRQERTLLATLPEWLDQHHERLRAAADASVSPPSSADWLAAFRADMQSLLLAELDLRLQPSEGLVAALRATVTA